MKIVKICAWCKKPMDFLSGLFRFFGLTKNISHGICWDCHANQLRKLNDFPGPEPKASPARRRNSLKEVA